MSSYLYKTIYKEAGEAEAWLEYRNECKTRENYKKLCMIAAFIVLPLVAVLLEPYAGVSSTESSIALIFCAYILGYGYASNHYKNEFEPHVYNQAIREAKKELKKKNSS